FCFVLRENGHLAFDPIDLRVPGKPRAAGPKKNLPSPLIQRTSGIKPNFLWDKSAYSLGITEKHTPRTIEENNAFITFHQSALEYTDDIGLIAFIKFIEWWNPTHFSGEPWFNDIQDQNIIFALQASYKNQFLHERTAARQIW